ncbi:hypothetical protein LguiA_019674 [Lonicera macranthoides]
MIKGSKVAVWFTLLHFFFILPSTHCIKKETVFGEELTNTTLSAISHLQYTSCSL